MVGSGAIIVLSEDNCIVKALQVISRFYAHESCGQCPPCREGTYWLTRLAERMERGEGEPSDPDTILDVCPLMMGTTVCVLSDAMALPARSYVQKFRDEFDRHIREKRCPFTRARNGVEVS
jgi:NADH-quinone oxidoreductase subunit F